MKRPLIHMHGNLPKYSFGTSKGRINRKEAAEKYGITVPLLFKAYLNWQHIFRFDGSTLTFSQYLDKLIASGLSPKDIGNNRGQYNLSRFNDDGPYTNESCRFILREANEKEVKRAPVTILKFVCNQCNKDFERRKGSENKGRFCSAKCVGLYNFYGRKLRRDGRVSIR